MKLISSSQIQFVAVVSFYAYGIELYGGFPRSKINHTLFLYNAQSNALVIDVAELYYLRVLSSDGKDVLNKRLLKDALYLECGSK